ncbi:hypothetical protein JOD17_003467 [Geomicrobium sediminis]|uniref:Uncharacterized protein n=1 Tax=Geomicrobium sediminis TaxID=1347788 RepID=A0ABS2PG16_9BACL|nr:hypothetical protein [Geomicrobium sediminis]
MKSWMLVAAIALTVLVVGDASGSELIGTQTKNEIL